MPKHERDRLESELERLETERGRLRRELLTKVAPDGPEAHYLSAQILRHRISAALLSARLRVKEA